LEALVESAQEAQAQQSQGGGGNTMTGGFVGVTLIGAVV
jgi:hypothetical protein